MSIVDTREVEGYTIIMELLPEHDAPDWDFVSDEERQQVLDDINNGNLLWFCAKVTASKCNVELATEYLGGCCFTSVDEFLEDVCYWDMVDTVVHMANDKLGELINN